MPVHEARRKQIREQHAAKFEALQGLARERGGRCLASEFHGWKAKLEFECAAGHRFTQYGDLILEGRWCLRCKRRSPEKLAEMQEIARAHGGECLSEEYLPWNQKMRFRCADGHEFEQTSLMIRGGSWCPRCRMRMTTIEGLNELAARHGGRCVSKQYRGSKHPLTWECAQGHRFRRLPGSVRYGRWSCPECREAAREAKDGD